MSATRKDLPAYPNCGACKAEDEGIDLDALWDDLRRSGYTGNVWPPFEPGDPNDEELSAAIEEHDKRKHLSQTNELEVHRREFAQQVAASLQQSSAKRLARLLVAPKLARQRAVTTTVFDRNPDVVAEVLLRAHEKCEYCSNPAPFNRRSDGTPYLEVHHVLPLSEGGEDTVENTVALCPNCHRREHNG